MLLVAPLSHAGATCFTPVIVQGGCLYVEKGFDPGQQRRDNLFRHARGAVLAHMPISGDACSCSPGPRLEPETAVRQVIPALVEIGDHLQELADDDGAPCWIIPQVARLSIQQRLIDATKGEPPTTPPNPEE